MPSIAAGSYPVESVQSVMPGLTPDAYQRIQASPEAFGSQIGEAQQRLGQTVNQAGDVAARAALARQDLYNNVTADEATNATMEEMLKIQRGDPNLPGDTGFFGKTGKDAMNDYPRATQALMDARVQGGAQLNPIAKLKYENDTRRQAAYMLNLMGAHYDQEMKSYQASVNRGSAAVGAQQVQAGANMGDENQIIAGLAAQKRAIAAMPISEEEKLAKTNEATALAVEAQVTAVSAHAPDRAMSILEANKASIVDKDRYDTLYNRLKQQNTQMWSDYYSGQGPKPGSSSTGGTRSLIDYTPSTNLLSGIGMSAAQYNIYRQFLAAHEAASYAGPDTGKYIGQYQMGPEEIQGAATRLGVPVPTREQFLANPQLQEQLFDNYTLNNHNQLMATSDKYRSADPTERAAILAGAHLGGPGNVQEYLNGISDKADSNGTHISSYVIGMRAAQSNSSIPTTEVWGDSLGVGMKKALGAPGNAVGGLQPQAIYDNILKMPKEHWKGLKVVLAAGSNGNDIPTVEKTIQYLKDNQANVVVIGLANQPQKSAALSEVAGRLGVPVVAPEDYGSGIHPSGQGYNSMAGKVRTIAAGANAPDAVVPTTMPAAPLIKDAVARGFVIPQPDPNSAESPDENIPGLSEQIAKSVGEIIKDGTAQGKTQYDMQTMIDATIKKVRTQYNAQYRESQIARQNQAAQVKAASDALETPLAARIYSGSPNLPTEAEVAGMIGPGKLTHEAGDRQIKNIRAALKEDKVIPGDADNSMALDKRLLLPYGEPDKILDRGPIDAEYQNGKISVGNRDKLVKELEDYKTELGVKLGSDRQAALSDYDLQVRGRKDTLGTYMDPTSGDRAFKFRDWLKQEEKALLKANKDPQSLYISTSPDFFAKNGIPRQFRAPLLNAEPEKPPPVEYNSDGTTKGPWDDTNLPIEERTTALKTFAQQQGGANYQMAKRIIAKYNFAGVAPEAK